MRPKLQLFSDQDPAFCRKEKANFSGKDLDKLKFLTSFFTS
jgi:hypothetical protein